MICVVLKNRIHYSIIKNTSFQISVCIFIFIFHSILYATVIIVSQVKNILTTENVTTLRCIIDDVQIYQAINTLYLVESNLIPFIVMISTTTVIAIFMLKFFKKIEKDMKPGMQEKTRLRKHLMKDVKYAINSIILNIFYLMFQTPIVLSYFIIMNPQNVFFSIWIFLFLLNFSYPIFVFLAVNPSFRREFMKITGFRSHSIL